MKSQRLTNTLLSFAFLSGAVLFGGCPTNNQPTPPTQTPEQIAVFTNQITELNKRVAELTTQNATLTADLNKSKQETMACNQELAATKDALKAAQDEAAKSSSTNAGKKPSASGKGRLETAPKVDKSTQLGSPTNPVSVDSKKGGL